MNQFFKVKTLDEVLALKTRFQAVASEPVPVQCAHARVLAEDILAREDMPGFNRATMDGYAVHSGATFGASESSPAWLTIAGTILMGETPDFTLAPGEAARISTGGMLPEGADSVVMVEHTDPVDENSVEIYKSVAPRQNVIEASEDFARDQQALAKGTWLRPQEMGLAAGLGFEQVAVFKKPKVAVISTGDEIIPIGEFPSPGKIRDINSTSIAGMVHEADALPVSHGIVPDNPDELKLALEKALLETDMVLISGGSSVGTKDYTLDVLQSLPDTKILVHGMSVSPGKPTILADSGGKPVWGLPGQVVSAMVVFKIAVVPFLERIKGAAGPKQMVTVRGKLSRNIASAQGRRDFVRVALEKKDGLYSVKPVLGKSGLIKTMVYADGLLEIGEDVEGVEKDTLVDVILL